MLRALLLKRLPITFNSPEIPEFVVHEQDIVASCGKVMVRQKNSLVFSREML
jgi:hypothetical protein